MRHAVGWGGLGPALDAFNVATITSATVAAIFCSFLLVLASLSGPQEPTAPVEDPGLRTGTSPA